VYVEWRITFAKLNYRTEGRLESANLRQRYVIFFRRSSGCSTVLGFPLSDNW